MEGSIDGENKQEWREEQMGALGCANSRLRPEPRHAFKFAKFHSEKGPSKNILQRIFFFYRWLHRISRILAVLDYEGVKQATPEVLRPKRKSSAHSL